MTQFADLSDAEKEPYFELAVECLSDLKYCSRVWSAWGHGTMTQNDFIDADEDEGIVEEVAEKIYNFTQEKK